jgi:hypothetical protein
MKALLGLRKFGRGDGLLTQLVGMDKSCQADWRVTARAPFARRVTPLAVILLALALASCSSFSGYVSDHWPTWAGGMPKDVPPRPGQPGYDEFIAHGQGAQGQPPQTNTTNSTANNPPTVTPVAATTPVGAAPAPAAATNLPTLPPGNPQTNNPAATRGGLY